MRRVFVTSYTDILRRLSLEVRNRRPGFSTSLSFFRLEEPVVTRVGVVIFVLEDPPPEGDRDLRTFAFQVGTKLKVLDDPSPEVRNRGAWEVGTLEHISLRAKEEEERVVREGLRSRRPKRTVSRSKRT